jgi:hypothetical protein
MGHWIKPRAHARFQWGEPRSAVSRCRGGGMSDGQEIKRANRARPQPRSQARRRRTGPRGPLRGEENGSLEGAKEGAIYPKMHCRASPRRRIADRPPGCRLCPVAVGWVNFQNGLWFFRLPRMPPGHSPAGGDHQPPLSLKPHRASGGPVTYDPLGRRAQKRGQSAGSASTPPPRSSTACRSGLAVRRAFRRR